MEEEKCAGNPEILHSGPMLNLKNKNKELNDKNQQILLKPKNRFNIQIPEYLPTTINKSPVQEEKNNASGNSEMLKTNFWRKTLNWKERKTIAEDLIALSNVNEEQDFFSLAFKGDYKSLKSFYIDHKKKLFNESDQKEDLAQKAKLKETTMIEELILEKISLGLTPLIYAIWGEQNRNDIEKKTSKWLFKISNHWLKQKKENRVGKYFKPSFLYDFHLKNEIGHIKVHGLIKGDLVVYDMVNEDLYEAVSYVIECEGFKLYKMKIDHDAYSSSSPISILAFALRVKSIRCANLLFENLMKHIKDPSHSYMLEIIQDELVDYILFNSIIVGDLIQGITNIQERSLLVDINNIPQFKMIKSKQNQIEIESYKSFEKFPNAIDFIKCQIINSKVLLPSISGSSKSLKLIQALSKTKNMMLFKITLIKSYLLYKWNQMWLLIFFHSMLMWINIPLMALVVFDYDYDAGLLISLTILNVILAMFELFQFTSMSLIHDLEGNDIINFLICIRFAFLGLMFIPNFQPYSCTIYYCLTVCISVKNGNKLSILDTLL